MKVKNVNTSCIGGNLCFLFCLEFINALLVLSICAPIQLHPTQQSPMGVVLMELKKPNTKFCGFALCIAWKENTINS